MKKQVHRPLVISVACVAVVITFLVSIGLPVFYDPTDREAGGFLCLIFGCLGFPSAWLANPGLVVWYILFLNRYYRGAFILSVANVALAMTSFFLTEFRVPTEGRELSPMVSGFGYGISHLPCQC